MLDIEFVRQQFPALNDPAQRGSAFFENAGGSYMCSQVIERLNDYYRKNKVQPYYPYPQSQRAGEQMDAAYGALADWLNVDADQVYLGPSTSQNTYVLAQAVLGWLQPGDEIIVTNQDHEANSGVWRRLEQRGIVVNEWRVDPVTGSLDIAQLAPLLSDPCKLLAFPHCSNILGELNPVAEICTLAAEHGVRTVVDGVSFAGHGLVDFQALQADIYLFSLYKVFGPHQGVMVISSEMAALLSNQSHFFNEDVRAKRLCAAGPDHAQVAACTGVGDYFAALDRHHFADVQPVAQRVRAERVRQLITEAEHRVLAPLLGFFGARDDIRVLGPREVAGRAPTVSVVVEGRSPAEMVRQLGAHGVMCGGGHFYSYRLLQALGLDPHHGVLRFSLVHYTSPDEVSQLIDALERALAGDPRSNPDSIASGISPQQTH